MKIETVDLILIAVKLWDTEDVAQALRPVVEEGAAVLSLQNGVEKDEVLRRLPTESIRRRLLYIGLDRQSWRDRSSRSYSAHGNSVNILGRSRRALERDAEISLNIERLIWEKFVFLVGLSGTTTSMRHAIGSIRQKPQNSVPPLGPHA